MSTIVSLRQLCKSELATAMDGGSVENAGASFNLAMNLH